MHHTTTRRTTPPPHGFKRKNAVPEERTHEIENPPENAFSERSERVSLERETRFSLHVLLCCA
jgi:hypothetical protein